MEICHLCDDSSAGDGNNIDLLHDDNIKGFHISGDTKFKINPDYGDAAFNFDRCRLIGHYRRWLVSLVWSFSVCRIILPSAATGERRLFSAMRITRSIAIFWLPG
jgi:hypothetical protein